MAGHYGVIGTTNVIAMATAKRWLTFAWKIRLSFGCQFCNAQGGYFIHFLPPPFNRTISAIAKKRIGEALWKIFSAKILLLPFCRLLWKVTNWQLNQTESETWNINRMYFPFISPSLFNLLSSFLSLCFSHLCCFSLFFYELPFQFLFEISFISLAVLSILGLVLM